MENGCRQQQLSPQVWDEQSGNVLDKNHPVAARV